MTVTATPGAWTTLLVGGLIMVGVPAVLLGVVWLILGPLARPLQRRRLLREAAAEDRLADDCRLEHRLKFEAYGRRSWLLTDMEREARARARILREEAARLARHA